MTTHYSSSSDRFSNIFKHLHYSVHYQKHFSCITFFLIICTYFFLKHSSIDVLTLLFTLQLDFHAFYPVLFFSDFVICSIGCCTTCKSASAKSASAHQVGLSHIQASLGFDLRSPLVKLPIYSAWLSLWL